MSAVDIAETAVVVENKVAFRKIAPQSAVRLQVLVLGLYYCYHCYMEVVALLLSIVEFYFNKYAENDLMLRYKPFVLLSMLLLTLFLGLLFFISLLFMLLDILGLSSLWFGYNYINLKIVRLEKSPCKIS